MRIDEIIANNSPNRLIAAGEKLKLLNSSKSLDFEGRKLSTSQSLKMQLSANLSRNKMRVVKKSIEKGINDNLIASERDIFKEKENCCPKNIFVDNLCVKVPFKDAIDHTISRILQKSKLPHDKNENKKLTFILKWGFDGSHTASNYKFKGETKDSFFFISMFVPLVLKSDKNIFFENDAPNSSTFCRPFLITVIIYYYF